MDKTKNNNKKQNFDAAVKAASTSQGSKFLAKPAENNNRPTSLGVEALPKPAATRTDELPSTSGTGRLPETAVSKGKHTKPSKQRYNDRRLSLRIIERLGKVDPETLTSKERDSLNWARGVADKQDVSRVKENIGKRLRSPDEPPAPKRPKAGSTGSKAFVEVVKDSLVLAVIDRGDVDGSIPRDKWSTIENAMSSVYTQVLMEMPGAPPVCGDAGWYQGRIKLIAFGDKRSIECYRSALKKIGEVWPGASLDVIEKDDIPSRPRAHAWIPSIPEDAESILERLKACNPNFPTHNWKVGRLDVADGARRHAVFILNAESLPCLAKTKGFLSYGFNQISLKVYKNDMVAESTGTVLDTTDAVPVRESAVVHKEESSVSSFSDTMECVGNLFHSRPDDQLREEDLLADSEEDDEDDAEMTVVERSEISHDTQISSNKPPSL